MLLIILGSYFSVKVGTEVLINIVCFRPFICIGYADGFIDLYNFVQHKLFTRRDLIDYYKIIIPPKNDSVKGNCEVTIPQLKVTCLKYSPSGRNTTLTSQNMA